MPDLSFLYHIVSCLPLDGMELRFMQQAFIALLLLAPMTAGLGVQVVQYRMAFFSDAVGHSAFAGVALGLFLGIHPHLSMLFFGLMIGMLIMFIQRLSSLPTDSVIGVVFSAVVALGIAIVSRTNTLARDVQQFLYGDILTLSENDIFILLILFLFFVIFQLVGFNTLLYSGISKVLAKTHKKSVSLCEYAFSGLLALVVMFSVWSVGVLLVTAMLIVPAAAARNLSHSAGGMFWWAIVISTLSSIIGLSLSTQPWLGTATGATVILSEFFFFLISIIFTSACKRK